MNIPQQIEFLTQAQTGTKVQQRPPWELVGRM